MNSKAFVAVGISVVIGVSSLVSACGKKEEKPDYESLYIDMSNKYNSASSQIEGLKLALASFDKKYENDIDLSRYTMLNTGEKSFNKFNDKVYFDGEISFDSTDALQNNSKLYLVSNISIAPSDSWIIQTTSSNTELYNSNGIFGQIKLYKIYDSTPSEFIYDKFVKQFMEDNKFPVLNNQTLFIGSSKGGVEITSKVHLKDTGFGSDYRMIKNNSIYSSEELEAMQSAADESVQASEAARIEAYLETLETSEPETNESGETIETTIDLPETSANAPDLATGEVEVLLPQITETESDYMFKVGVIMNSGVAVVYEFVYKDDDRAAANNEILRSLITSMQVDTLTVSME